MGLVVGRDWRWGVELRRACDVAVKQKKSDSAVGDCSGGGSGFFVSAIRSCRLRNAKADEFFVARGLAPVGLRSSPRKVNDHSTSYINSKLFIHSFGALFLA